MSNVIKRLFDMRSKEEKEEAYQNYFSLIFPYGEMQKIKMQVLVNKLFPKERKKYSFLFYILLKEEYLQHADFEEALKKVQKKKIIGKYAQLSELMRLLLMYDLEIDERLDYPSSEEIRTQIHV